MSRARRISRARRGQTIVEIAMIFPLFIMLLMGIIVLGIGVFYQQQVTNAAREAARFAAIHSATAICPTASKLPPNPKPSDRYWDCDSAIEEWPAMREHAQVRLFGLPREQVRVAACWSGYVDDATGAYDAAPPGEYEIGGGVTINVSSTWAQCTIDGVDPTVSSESIDCDAGLPASTADRASNLSEGPGRIVANRVTAVACYVWSPPMAGFLLIPETVTLRGVITEAIQRQQ